MITVHDNVANVREWFSDLKKREEYVTDKTGCRMLEVVGATFIADEETIFGEVNRAYVEREIMWYKSMSRNVHDIPGGAPTMWVKCADPHGMINSNYGYLIWSDENHKQYQHVLDELRTNTQSRRAEMIYTRPSMWNEYNTNGMSDFVCTDAVQYFIRDEKLVAVVKMRSNDLVFGYRNDFAWQDHVHRLLSRDLGIDVGQMVWHAGSLHVYQRHFDLIT